MNTVDISNIPDKDFVESALNAYWNDAHQNLERKDLGDLEKIMYQKRLAKAFELLKLFENESQITLI